MTISPISPNNELYGKKMRLGLGLNSAQSDTVFRYHYNCVQDMARRRRYVHEEGTGYVSGYTFIKDVCGNTPSRSFYNRQDFYII